MDKQRKNIAIIEPSVIVYEGLCNLLMKSLDNSYVYGFNDLMEFEEECETAIFNVVIVNPIAIINKVGSFHKLRKKSQGTTWIALQYTLYEQALIAKFDDVLSIFDDPELFFQKISKSMKQSSTHDKDVEELSDREIEVLEQLVKGFSNKEIANSLNISIHTVISHRKRIVEKTGIKSLPGLTIFAISKNIISMDASSL